MKRVGVVSLLPYFEEDGQCFLPAFDAGSHRIWTDHFAETLLLKPRLVAAARPEGWQPLIGSVVPRPLFATTPTGRPGFFTRRREAIGVLRRAVREVGLLYLRAPAWECSWALTAARGSGTPLLTELHGDWESAFRAEWAAPPLKRALRGPVAHWAHRRTARMAREATVLCCVGEALREKYATPGGSAYVTTAHLLREDAFRHRDDTCEGDLPQLLFVGELVPRKGVRFLLEAAQRLRDAGHRFRLDVIGDGPLRADLEARVANAGLSDVVAFRGAMSHGTALLEWYRRADVFVLPSIAGEGVPRVIQEAMASSCPVVATEVGSVRRQLGDGAHGIPVPREDPEALAAAIARILSDGEHRRALIASAREEALHHSYERQSAAVRRILEEHFDRALLTSCGPR